MKLCRVYRALLGALFVGFFVSPICPASADLDETFDYRVVQIETGQEALIVFIDGPIRMHHAEHLGEIKTLASDASIRYLVLNSPGGDMAAAIKLGRFFRDNEFDAFVPNQMACYSACVLLLAAGIEKVVEGSLGIHRPYLVDLPGSSIKETMAQIKRDLDIYFSEMNIPSLLVDKMFSIDPAEIHILDEQEILFFRLGQMDLVAREAKSLEGAKRHGVSRQQYDAFRDDMNHICTGLSRELINECIYNVMKKHDICFLGPCP